MGSGRASVAPAAFVLLVEQAAMTKPGRVVLAVLGSSLVGMNAGYVSRFRAGI